jgi:undecaprenyl-diphosphatase
MTDTTIDDTDRPLVRSPTSLLHLVVGVVTLLVGALVTWRFANTAAALNLDWEAVIDPLPTWLEAVPLVLVVAVLLLSPVVVNVQLLRYRRWRLLLVVNVAAVVALVTSELLVAWLTRDPPSLFPDAYVVDGRTVTPNDALLAAFVAAAVVGLPYIGRSIRRLVVVVVALHLFSSLTFGEAPSVSWVLDVGIGITVGAAVALAVGTPDTRPDARSIIAALGRSGWRMAEVSPASVDARGSVPWFGTTEDGRRLFIKVLNQDNRSADLLFRVTRVLLLRNSGDERPPSSLRRAVEHEALVSLKATADGIRTPSLEAVSEVGADAMLLAYGAIDGDSLDRVPDEALDDDTLDAIWRQVADLRAAGIAHRDLRLANVFLGSDGRVQLIDFGFAELAASDLLLETDVAELLGSTTTKVGTARAVAAAIRVLGRDAVADALPRLQPYALGSATRTALRQNELFEPLRAEVRRQAHVEGVRYEPLAPLRPGRLGVVVAVGVAFWVVVPILLDLPDALGDVLSADLVQVAFVLVASAATYLGAAVTQIGALRDPLQLGPTIEARLASSFANRLTPARTGGTALGVRALQKQGVATDVALGSVGLAAVAGLVVHLVILSITVQVGIDTDSLDLGVDADAVLPVALGVAGVVAGAVLLVPRLRRAVVGALGPALSRSFAGLRDVAGRPVRLVQLALGPAVTTAAYATALVLSVRAVGGDLDTPSIVLAFLVAAIVAAPVPTPGGLVAVEAALIAGLVVLGETTAVAVAAVFIYRLATYWLPIVPGFLAIRAMRDSGRL